MRLQRPSDRFVKHLQNRRHLNPPGNVLIYVVVLMLIFGVLGVVMVSLFTSATASTVTRNDSRRARYLSESGVRYAIGELRKADFDSNHIINILNTINYTVSGAGSFKINIFSPWFDSNTSVDSPAAISLSVPLGELPDDFTAPNGAGVWVVNYDYITGTGPDITTTRDRVASYTKDDATNLTIGISSDFVVNQDERVCLAVEPSQAQSGLNEGDDLFVVRDARLFFPKFNGAVNINRVDYSYDRLVDDPDNNRVILENLTASKFPNVLPAFPLDVEGDTGGTYSGDFVVLSPRNYMVMSDGTSGPVSLDSAYAQGMNVYDHSLIRPGSLKADITAEDFLTNLREQESDTQFFEKDMVEYKLDIGGGQTDEFGSAFFDADMSIGGEQDYCQEGACTFALGVRVFFLLDFNQQGDGITFTLLSKGFGALGPPNNSASSMGGDFQLSELMGYAGDGRLDAAGTTYLVAEDDRGLDPPKIAVEFDTRTDNAAGDPPPDYCADASTANFDTRNDPLASNKDAVQYVFWGRTSFLNIPCRDNNTLYDDNRHDADGEEATEEWRFEDPTGPMSFWRPAIGPDGTIYMSARETVGDGKIYALNEDGSVKWTYSLGAATGGNNDYMPGVDPDTGTIYSDIQNDRLVAINPDGSFKWDFFMGADVDSTPVVGPDGTIYFGTDIDDSGNFYLYALNPDGTQKWRFPTGDDVDNVPALNSDASAVYVVSNDDNLYAVNTATGAMIWSFPIGADGAESGELNSSPAVDPGTGTIYVGSDDHNVYAVNPDGSEKWRYTTGTDVESSPVVAVDPIDGITTVYIGSDDDNVYALNANTGAKKWQFDAGANVVSSPIVDLDGTIYVGSEDTNVYAINPDGTQKWIFSTGGIVRSSPALGEDGFIHIGSHDTNFFTISQFADPRNFKDEDKSAGKLLTVEDLDSAVMVNSNTDWLNGAGAKGSWAVRLEVDRSVIPNADGKFDYELRLWIRQCPDQNDFPCSNILGTFYEDTRLEYDYTAVQDLPMIQRFSLSGIEQDAFESFFFGFTGAAGAEALQATISNFQLSFVRPGDSVVDCDSINWPVEAPVTDCIPEL